ncbi:hypothetical protein CON84_12690 [Bacillus sp. AFS094228]|nr:hypothetical protein CON84_12690 [Bacillus sp. AFS094228]
MHLIYLESKGRYEAPKIHESLLTKGFSLSLKRVHRLMRRREFVLLLRKNTVPIHLKKRLFNWIIC